MSGADRLIEFYGLREQPFVSGSDCRFAPVDRMRREVLASLYFGVLCNRNLLTLVAPDGLGKTLLLHQLVARLQREARIAFLVGAPRDRCGLLREALEEFGVAPSGGDLVATRDQLCRFATDQREVGRRSVLIVDDAHNLDAPDLEEIELLSRLGAASPDLLQVVLAGAPSLTDALQDPGLAAFRQRLTSVPGLDPLSPADTAGYIDHQLRTAGYDATTPLFTPEALKRVAAATNGVPQRIDVVCRRALTLGCIRKVTRIGRLIVEEAVARPAPDHSRPAQAPGAVSVEHSLEPLPMAAGQGSMRVFPTMTGPALAPRGARPDLQAAGGQALVPASRTASPAAELPQAIASPGDPDAVAQGGPWRLCPAIEEAMRPRERVGGLRPPVKSASWSPTRIAAAPARPAPADTPAESPEAPPVADATRRQEERPATTDTPVTYALPADSLPLSKLVQSLLAARNDPAPRNILFVSVDQGAQTAHLCADVAKILAASGTSRVLVVDADRNLSALQDQFGVGSKPGLAEVLDSRLSIEGATVPVGPKLSLLTSGLVTHPSASCLLPQQVADLMSELRSRFDYVLVNGMPLKQGSDSVVFGRSAEGVLLVVAAHATRRAAARQAKAQLETAGARLLGAVLTERTFPIPDAIYRRL